MLRWRSWNLWAIGPELRTRSDAARATLEQLAPDLCCLQEVRAARRATVRKVSRC